MQNGNTDFINLNEIQNGKPKTGQSMYWNSWFTSIEHYNVILLEKRMDCDDEDTLKYV